MIEKEWIENLKIGVDERIREMLDHPTLAQLPELKAMLGYPLGMDGEPGSASAHGKRIRPLILLLSAEAVGGDWEKALSAAAAVELMHNFSLIHDDIQDKSELRRGRPTVWVKWGIAQAINAGDAMLGLAQLALVQDAEILPNRAAIQLFTIFNQTLLRLTGGQYMDLAFEQTVTCTIPEYDRMVAGKTGALLAACFEMGALIGGADASVQEIMSNAGRATGRAFQIQDDWLGIWGSEKATGKSVHSDLMERKKTYPIIKGLQNNGEFAGIWRQIEAVSIGDAEKLAALLDQEGVKKDTEQVFRTEYANALELLSKISVDNNRLKPLQDLLHSFLDRIR